MTAKVQIVLWISKSSSVFRDIVQHSLNIASEVQQLTVNKFNKTPLITLVFSTKRKLVENIRVFTTFYNSLNNTDL